jgi:hypothetical protein
MWVRPLLRSTQAGLRVDLVLGLLLVVGVLTGVAADAIGVNCRIDLI